MIEKEGRLYYCFELSFPDTFTDLWSVKTMLARAGRVMGTLQIGKQADNQKKE